MCIEKARQGHSGQVGMTYPKKYKHLGQPVLIPGSMGSASYVLAGRTEAMTETFGSSCHGSGRVMSRHQAIREIPTSRTLGDMKNKGIELRVRDKKLISEEAEWAYKDVNEVVQSIAGAKDIKYSCKACAFGRCQRLASMPFNIILAKMIGSDKIIK